MSDQNPSGAPSAAPETAVDAPQSAAPTSTPAPTGQPAATPAVGTFGNARGSGLSRGKRASSPSASAATPAPAAGYKPTAVEVITPVREYTNPFASSTPATAPVNEPAAPAAPAEPVQDTSIPVANAPVTGASEPPAATAPAAGEPIAPPAEVIQPSVEKAEIKILPPADAKRPAVSWGEGYNVEDTRPPQRDQRPSFRPERRERDPRNFEPRDSGKPQDTRFPRRDIALEQRDARPRESSAPRQPEKKSGGFLGWLKGLFGGNTEQPAATAPGSDRREGEAREGEHRHRRRNRGGRGRNNYHGGENRGPREDRQPRPEGFQGGSDQGQGGDRRFEGGNGRRRRRGGRGRYRDDRGDRGPNPEGQQGGGAI